MARRKCRWDAPVLVADRRAESPNASLQDFVNAWDRNVLQEAIDTCTAESGEIEECELA